MDNKDGILDRLWSRWRKNQTETRKIEGRRPAFFGSYSSIAKNQTHVPTNQPTNRLWEILYPLHRLCACELVFLIIWSLSVSNGMDLTLSFRSLLPSHTCCNRISNDKSFASHRSYKEGDITVYEPWTRRICIHCGTDFRASSCSS